MEDKYIIGNNIWRLLAVLTLPAWIVPVIFLFAIVAATMPEELMAWEI